MVALSPSLARQVIRDFLTSHPGATKDRIYDELVSRMVQAGKMESHDFNALLRGVAEEVQEPVKENLFDNKEPDLFGSHISSRWYLKETADEVDTAEQEKEDAAAARLEKYMATHLRKHPEDEGVHYSDLFEQYPPDRRQAEAAPGRLAPRILLQDDRRHLASPHRRQGAGAEGRPASDRHPAADQAVRQRPDRRRARAGQGPTRQRRTPSPTGFASAAVPASSSRAVRSTRRAA